MREYKIRDTGKTMIIIDGEKNKIAEYQHGGKKAAVQRMRRAIDKHLSKGGMLGNYQW